MRWEIYRLCQYDPILYFIGVCYVSNVSWNDLMHMLLIIFYGEDPVAPVPGFW